MSRRLGFTMVMSVFPVVACLILLFLFPSDWPLVLIAGAIAVPWVTYRSYRISERWR